MPNATDIKALVVAALQKQASSVDSKRNDEHEKDIKDNVVASVDSQTAADATGRMEKDPAMNIGTKAEASTDSVVNGLPRETNDGEAFKEASALQKLAATITAGITRAVESSQLSKEATDAKPSDAAAKTAITVDAAEGGSTGKNSVDDPGTQECIEGGEEGGEAAQTTTDATQTAATKVEAGSSSEEDPAKSAGVLAAEIYEMANFFLNDPEDFTKQASAEGLPMEEDLVEGDIKGLEGSESDELASALEAAAMDASGEGTEDADNVADYLQAYQDVPGMGEEGMGEEGIAPEAVVAPDQAAVAPEGAPEEGMADVDALAAMLQEAGIGPEELAGLGKQASVQDDAWKGLTKEAKREVIFSVIKDLK